MASKESAGSFGNESSDSQIDCDILFGVGAKFLGRIKGYGDVSYEFIGDIPSAPPEVVEARKAVFTCMDHHRKTQGFDEIVFTKSVHCVCKALEIDERVVISSDDRYRMLLQSILKPELGILIFRPLRKGGVFMLVGGDELWTPADDPTVEVTLVKKADAYGAAEDVEKKDSETSASATVSGSGMTPGKATTAKVSGARRSMFDDDLPATRVSATAMAPVPGFGFDSTDDKAIYKEICTRVVSTAGGGNLKELKECVNEYLQFLPANLGIHAAYGANEGLTPLCLAAEKGRLEVVTWLIEVKKADPHFKSKLVAPNDVIINGSGGPVGIGPGPTDDEPVFLGGSPMYHACQKPNNIDVVKFLLECRADAEDGLSPCCTRGDARMLQTLFSGRLSQLAIEKAVVQSAKNGHGGCLVLALDMEDGGKHRKGLLQEALFAAVQSGKTSTVKILLEQGANPHAKNEAASAEDEKNCLQIAEMWEHENVLEILKAHKVPRIGKNCLAAGS